MKKLRHYFFPFGVVFFLNALTNHHIMAVDASDNNFITQQEEINGDPTATDEWAQEEPSLSSENPSDNASGALFNPPVRKLLINFNNVNIIEYLRFISKISNKNFVFDEADLQFNVTIISEEATPLENIMAALIQELRIHDLSLIEQGNNFIIHKNPGVNSLSKIVDSTQTDFRETDIVTHMFRLNTSESEKVAAILRPFVSEKAILEVLKETNNLIVTDIATNVRQIAKLLKIIDASNNGLVIGQYVIRQGKMDALIELAQSIMLPIAQDLPLTFVPHPSANSIFIVSSPFLVERTISILQYLDQYQGITRIFNLDDLKFSPQEFIEAAQEAAEEAAREAEQEEVDQTLSKLSRLTPSEWQVDREGNWFYRPVLPPGLNIDETQPPPGYWTIDEFGDWSFHVTTEAPPTPEGAGISGVVQQEQPLGRWALNAQGAWVFVISPGETTTPGRPGKQRPSGWQMDKQGNWIFRPLNVPGISIDKKSPPPGYWTIDEKGNWRFRVTTEIPPAPEGTGISGVVQLEQPVGRWILDSQGAWVFLISPGETITPGKPGRQRPTGWQLDKQGNWIFRPLQPPGVTLDRKAPPPGFWTIDEQGNWRFRATTEAPTPQEGAGISGVLQTQQPEGRWVLDAQGAWVFQIAPGKSITPERLRRPTRTAELPVGHIDRTQFFIYKLKYRKGDQVQIALFKIARSLQQISANNADLTAAIESVQWIEASNSLIFTGAAESLDKVKELIEEVDAPLRQVFIEMLILETSLEDSLNYGVEWGSRFGGGDVAGQEMFISPGSPIPRALSTTGPGLTPDASSLRTARGFSLGIVGQQLTHNGTVFASIAALVKAVHDKTTDNVVMNPKLITEDNYPAQIFVGINTPFKTQSIVNSLGEIVTENFEYRDVGSLMKVTPLIGSSDLITLIIEQELSSLAPVLSEALGSTIAGPTTRKSRTLTRVHLPSGFFLVMSGQMEDQKIEHRNQVPCLGGIPGLGAAFADQQNRNRKRNLMIFIRPEIVDSEEEIDRITRHQQDVWINKKKTKKSWQYEVEGALNYMNIKGLCGDPCEDECDDEN